jgi:selenide,water dikinase
LTKPLGTGTLFAADMRRLAKARWIDGAVQTMLQSNQEASKVMRNCSATACTDVTGFGLLGHLVEMTKASGVDARLVLGSVPILDGACETTAAGLLSSLQPQNLRLRRAVANVSEASRDLRYPILFDPQTAGGLLASVPASDADSCVTDLHDRGYLNAAIIGTVESRHDRDSPIWIDM